MKIQQPIITGSLTLQTVPQGTTETKVLVLNDSTKEVYYRTDISANGKLTVENKNSGYSILTTDNAKVFVCNSTSTQTFNLPSVTASDIGFYCTIIKIGSGQVTIDAADSDTIQDSGAGDTIYCADTGIASITLVLCRETAWYITSAVGTWVTTD